MTFEDFIKEVVAQASRFGLGWLESVILILLLAVMAVGIKAGIGALRGMKPNQDPTGIETPGGGPPDDWFKTHPQKPTEGRPPESESGSGG